MTNQRTQTTVTSSSEEKHQQGPLRESTASSLPPNQHDSNVVAVEEKLKKVID
jgi:hypothetical protein